MKLTQLLLMAPFFGRTSNKISTLVNMLSYATHANKELIFDVEWKFFLLMNVDIPLLNSHPNINLEVNRCKGCEQIDSKTAFYFPTPTANFTSLLQTFVKPPVLNRNQAESILNVWKAQRYLTVSVHRRGLEGSCVRRMNSLPLNLRTDACNFTANSVITAFAPKVKHFSSVVVFILSDGQDRRGDELMRKVLELHGVAVVMFQESPSMLLDYWIATSTDIHLPNPVSSIDRLVGCWRGGK